MKLYLQMGDKMQGYAKTLIKSWGNGSVILSPVNIKETRIAGFSESIHELNGQVLFDPQLFYPHNGHKNLIEYDYWPSGTLSERSISDTINKELLKLNNSIKADKIILPCGTINELNFTRILSQINQSALFFRNNTDKKILATLCISCEAIRNQQFIEDITQALSALDVDGYYLICQQPNDSYLNLDPLWEIQFVKLVACLKLVHKEVIVGYSSHQNLILSLAKVDGIAAGSYLNTRSFQPKKFRSIQEEGIKQRSVWFYVPEALSEYKALSLDVAQQRGFLGMFRPQGNYYNSYSSMLFSGATPSSTNYNEGNSFLHYLYCLNKQCQLLTKSSYEETLNTYEFLLNSAETKISQIRAKGIRGQNRDFYPAIETNNVAMAALNEDYGLKLKLEWNSL